MKRSERDWDADTYDRVSDPQFAWGMEVLDRLSLDGNEVVLDVGCGTGRHAVELQKRLPEGHVVGVDMAPSMVKKARQALGSSATVIESDLLDLKLSESVDAVVSTATFHWITDHDSLFKRIHDILKPGGQFVSDHGGKGNVVELLSVVDATMRQQQFDSFFSEWRNPWYFAGVEETTARLEHAGFSEIDCWLEESPVQPTEPQAFLGAVVLRRHLKELPHKLQAPFVEQVLDEAVSPLTIDYVRLNISAKRRS